MAKILEAKQTLQQLAEQTLNHQHEFHASIFSMMKEDVKHFLEAIGMITGSHTEFKRKTLQKLQNRML